MADQLLENLRFLRRTAKFKFAKDQFLMVGEVMHQAADEIERLRAAIYQACSEMGCYCLEEDTMPEMKCPMCKLGKALHG